MQSTSFCSGAAQGDLGHVWTRPGQSKRVLRKLAMSGGAPAGLLSGLPVTRPLKTPGLGVVDARRGIVASVLTWFSPLTCHSKGKSQNFCGNGHSGGVSPVSSPPTLAALGLGCRERVQQQGLFCFGRLSRRCAGAGAKSRPLSVCGCPAFTKVAYFATCGGDGRGMRGRQQAAIPKSRVQARARLHLGKPVQPG